MTKRHVIARTVIIVLMSVAAGMCGGCDASGYPAFVKISPDGRFVTYQDGSHPKSYIYDAHRGRKVVFRGRVACMNENVSLLVLRGEPDRREAKCQLVILEPNGPKVKDLPVLPMSNRSVVRIMFIGEGPDMLALLYDSSWAERPAQAARLTHQSRRWENVPVPQEYCDQPLWMAHEPIGDRLSGYVFSPRDKSFRLPEQQEPGLNVDLAFDNHCPYYSLKSPRGDYTITVRDPKDPWNRLWLTERSGRRVLLLDQNDMPTRVVGAIAWFPGRLFLSLFGPQI